MSWLLTLALIAGADCVVANDSLAGHLAAAEGVPIVTVMVGPNEPERWRPLTKHGNVLGAPAGNTLPPVAEVLVVPGVPENRPGLAVASQGPAVA